MWKILLAVVCVLVGLFMAFRPDTVWEITESWKSKGADGPTDQDRRRVRGAAVFLSAGKEVPQVVQRCAAFAEDLSRKSTCKKNRNVLY